MRLKDELDEVAEIAPVWMGIPEVPVKPERIKPLAKFAPPYNSSEFALFPIVGGIPKRCTFLGMADKKACSCHARNDEGQDLSPAPHFTGLVRLGLMFSTRGHSYLPCGGADAVRISAKCDLSAYPIGAGAGFCRRPYDVGGLQYQTAVPARGRLAHRQASLSFLGMQLTQYVGCHRVRIGATKRLKTNGITVF